MPGLRFPSQPSAPQAAPQQDAREILQGATNTSLEQVGTLFPASPDKPFSLQSHSADDMEPETASVKPPKAVPALKAEVKDRAGWRRREPSELSSEAPGPGPFKRAERARRCPPPWAAQARAGSGNPAGGPRARGAAAPAARRPGGGGRRREARAGLRARSGPRRKARGGGAQGSIIWRGGSARPLGGRRVRGAEGPGGRRRGAQEERGGLSPALPEQRPARVGRLSWGPQLLRGLKLGVEEQGGVGPAVQEEGGVGPGVQERGGRGHEPSLGVVWGPPDAADWRRPARWTGSAGGPVAQEEGLGPRGQQQEKGGGGPVVQERGEARAGVQERGEGSPRRLLRQPEELPALADGGSCPHAQELESSDGRGWESCGPPGGEAVVLGASPESGDRLQLLGRARPVGPRGPEGEGRLGVQEANWLPGVQEGQVVWAVQETYLNAKGSPGGEGFPEGPRTRKRRRRRRW
nr:collagen alpha-1(II) chain [Meriones unguiculatus]